MITIDLHTEPEILTQYLEKMGWMNEGELVTAVSKAGEGNMNVVLRVQTNTRSLILKQSRPYVQKYPQIPAPAERIHTEMAFYRAVQESGIDAHLPKILGFEPAAYLMLLEDLGQAEDMTALYQKRNIAAGQLKTLLSVLMQIHKTSVPENFPQNLELRQLNHQHIFVLPFLEDNGFDLDSIQPGLQELATPIKEDDALKQIISQLGEIYLAAGTVLLHGDYYPGSWLQADDNIYVIDPEFCFAGFAEFDLGVMAAHLIMATQDPTLLDQILEGYTLPKDSNLARQVAGTEILRRIIGLAQLPLERSLEEKASLLELAQKFIHHDN